MWLNGLFSRGAISTLESLAAFTEARQRVLADNIANVDTPFYKARDLSPEAFAQQLRCAIDQRGPANGPLRLESSEQAVMDDAGQLRFVFQEVEHNNVLFHDQGNRSVEKLMAGMAKNRMMHEASTRLLAHEFQMLQMAIRGRP